jgi:uncharacterized protein (TIRG00374 family)
VTTRPDADVAPRDGARTGESAGAKARWYRAALLVCGGALCAYLILRIGLTPILESFRTLSWRLLIVIVFPCVVLKTFDTLAWGVAFPHERMSFLRLATALLAGQAVGSTTPAGLIGGNAVMAWMLRDRVSVRETLSSLIIFHTTSTASQGLFLLLGILLAHWTLETPPVLVRIMKWLLVLEVIGVVGFIAVQMRGIVAGGYRLLAWFGFSSNTALGQAATDVDEALATFYRRQPRRLALSLAFNFLGWTARAGETWLILWLLGASVSVPTALIVEAFATGISFATFFLPTDVGVEEGGAVATFLALGLSGATGLSLALVRRVREVAWTALGLLLLAGNRRPSKATLRVQRA